MDDKKKGGSQAAPNKAEYQDRSALRVRAMAAIGRAALWGLLPVQFAEKLIRRIRRAA